MSDLKSSMMPITYDEHRAALRRAEIEACAFCQENKGKMHPPHFASPNCESGQRNHCTCDLC